MNGEKPDHVTLSPTFNVQKSDDADLLAGIETLRAQLKQDAPNMAALSAFISKRAKDVGDLDTSARQPEGAGDPQ